MYFQLERLVLWSRHDPQRQRVLKFAPGSVNVISGYSKTGKSALIPIIDYCLGSDSCTIPVRAVRDKTAWFGIVVATGEEEILLARREPGSERTSGEMFILRSPGALELPTAINESNARVEVVKRTLDELAGLTRFDFDFADVGEGFGRPGFRDLVSLMFQPQNIIANPEVLFYKTSTSQYREKLRSIFPYVLGAVTGEALALQHERGALRSDLARKEREYQKLKAISARWLGEIRAKYQAAREVGLIQTAALPDASPHDLVELLRLAKGRAISEAVVKPDDLEGGVDRLVELEREETELSTQLVDLRRRLGEMRRLTEATFDYRGSLSIKRSRLAIADWLSSRIKSDPECPLCGSADQGAVDSLRTLLQAFRLNEAEISDFSSVPAAFDRELERVRREVGELTDSLSMIRREREALALRSETAREQRFISERVARLQGGLDEALKQYDELLADAPLAEELEALQNRLAEIDRRLRELDAASQLKRILRRISMHASSLLPKLDVERPDDPVDLSIPELTLIVHGEGRDDHLAEIGSGANWVGYHVVMMLALHDHFIRQVRSPVPGLVVFDQPSQVYFPQLSSTVVEKMESQGSPGLSAEVLVERDEDIQAVRRIYQVIAEETRRHEGKLQAFIFDHAGEATWGGIAGIHLVEEWRRGLKLVPVEWLEEKAESIHEGQNEE